MSDALLTDEHVREYWERGFTVVRGLFTAEELAAWDTRFLDIAEKRVPAAPRTLVMRDVMVAKGAVKPKSELHAIAKIQDFENDPVLDSDTTHPRMLDCVERLLGPNLLSIHCMLINKPPDVDGRHPLHQDLVYFPFRPADGVLGTWTALQRVTRENGCLVVGAGTHRGPLLEHENMDWEYVNSGYFGAKGAGELTERVHVACDPGDTILFHSLIVHGSGRNTTGGFRRAISCHYASADSEKTYEAKPEELRWYRPLRGRAPSWGEVPLDGARPGLPDYQPPKSTRRI